jgi:N-acetyl-gamma-glutamyl-phosphate reductase
MSPLQAAVVGASGYAGAELTRLLRGHPAVRPPALFRLNGETAGDAEACAPHADPSIPRFDWDVLHRARADVLFFCTPHAVSRELIPWALDCGYRVVDLSGAWRLKQRVHREAYALEDPDAAAATLDAVAAYGLSELNRDAIATARLVANPGCYATSIILALHPWLASGLIDLDFGVISDSKSGVSGAGKEPTPRTHFVEVSNNLSAYSVFGHRHTGEILEQLGLAPRDFQFTPHLLPIPRGILSTIYVRAAHGATEDRLHECLRDFFADAPFVRVHQPARLPEIKCSLHTNHCDIGFAMEPGGDRVVLLSCLDNLLKGAAGQAVQNMNLMFGRDEREGLA